MDPISLAASIAGLLTLTVQVIGVCDSLYHDVKQRPKLLRDLSADLTCLAAILEQLKSSLTEQATGDEAALRECLYGCNAAVKDVRFGLDAVRALLAKNIVVKTYAQITFKSKLAAIMESQERVDRFTGAINVALAVRQHVSAKVVHTKLDQLAVEILQVKKSSTRTAKWLDPLQQYVDTSFAVLTKSDTSSASSAVMSSSSTLVGEVASMASSQQDATFNDADAIASFGSFDDWLTSFIPEEGKGSNQPKTPPVLDLEPANRTSPAAYKAQLVVNGLPVGSEGSSKSPTQAFNLNLSDLWDDALRLLQQKGYRKICGFKLGSTLLTPVASYTDEVYVTVTKGPSTYSIAGGLRINIDTPLELYFDDFVRVGETGQAIQPMSLLKMSDEGKIVIVDHFGDSSKKIEIGLSRTLRVPEDGVLYNPPVLLSPFPLINTEELALDRLSLRKKGGLLVPLWQREALALTFSGENPKYRYKEPSLDFAVRIYAGSVNAISGATNKQSIDDAQDYVLAPVQSRLDGFLVRAGVVKQFVSMPLGAGYTAEGQLTDREVFGGLQVLIAPRFRARGRFRGYGDQRRTPRELGLEVDDRLFMAGDAVTSRSREFGYGDISRYFAEEGSMFHHSDQGRPLFVHEMAVLFSDMGNLSKPLSITAVLPYKLDIVVRPPKEYVYARYSPGQHVGLRSTRCSQAQLPREYSPFLGIEDLTRRLAKLLIVEEVVLFTSDNKELQQSSRYVPIHQVIVDGAIVYCQGYNHEHDMGSKLLGASPGRQEFEEPEPKKELRWDMGLAPGGEIKQDVVPDSKPLEWNWARARLVNVQIINSVIFENVTGIVPPPPPISFKDYIKARLPFFDLISDVSIPGGKVISGLQSVGQQDAQIGIPLQASLSKSKKMTGCVICEQNLADSILKPCSHVFCGLCVRDQMQQDGKTRCAACRKLTEGVVSFGAPMEIPLVGGRSPIRNNEANKQRQKSMLSIGSLSPTRDDGSHTASSKAVASIESILIQPASLLQRLALSSRKDDILEIDKLLAKGGGHCETVICENGRTAMQIAASNSNAELLEKLIAVKISVNELPCAINGRTALQAAAERGDIAIVNRLLVAGANPNAAVSLSGGLSALEGAAKIGDTAILALLLQHGASVRAHRTRKSALHHAAENGYETAVVLLLAHGFDPDTQVELPEKNPEIPGYSMTGNFSPSDMAAQRGQLSVLKILRKHGATSNPIYTSCKHGHVDVVRWLLDDMERKAAEKESVQEVDDEVEDEEESTSLSRYMRNRKNAIGDYGYAKREGFEGILDSLMESAVRHGHVEVLKLVLERGALLRIPGRTLENTDTEGPIYYRSTMLHEAAKSISPETVAYLLTRGFALDETPVYGKKTPLMEAAEAGQFATFEFLVARGANIHAEYSQRWTIAMLAARGGSEEILRLLFSLDVDITKMGDYSQSALNVALESGHESVAKLVLKQIDKQKHNSGHDDCLSSALPVAAEKALVFFVRELLERGADPNLNNALHRMGTYIQEETNEDDCISCACLLLAQGGLITDLPKVLKHLEYIGKFRLATVFVQHYVEADTEKPDGLKWTNRMEIAAKRGAVEYFRTLVGSYRRTLGEKGGEAVIPWDFRLASAFVAASSSGTLEIVDLLLRASSEEAVRRYLGDVSQRFRPNDHVRLYLEETYVLKATDDEPMYRQQR